MCGPANYDSRPPEEALADLIARETGVRIDKHALRMFVRSQWSKVSVLGHAIHNAGEIARYDAAEAKRHGQS